MYRACFGSQASRTRNTHLFHLNPFRNTLLYNLFNVAFVYSCYVNYLNCRTAGAVFEHVKKWAGYSAI